MRDMWLTGFDAPCLHTMYVDKPMRGHGLMQAIARVNRVFKDKPGGLVVDYLGLADELKQALATYTESGGTGKTAIDQDEAVALMLEKYEVCRGLFHGFDWSLWMTGTPHERLSLLPAAQEHILAQEDGKNRLLHAVTRAVAGLCACRAARGGAAHPRRRGVLSGRARGAGEEHAGRAQDRRGAGPRHPANHLQGGGLRGSRRHLRRGRAEEAGHLDPLGRVPGRSSRHAAAKSRRRTAAEAAEGRDQDPRAPQCRAGAVLRRLLEQSLRRYQNRAIETAQVIEELIQLAKDMREADAARRRAGPDRRRGRLLRCARDQRQRRQGAGRRRRCATIARELVETVRKNVTIDWTVRENVRAHLRVLVKRILRKYGYPPDKQEKATRPVLEQAEALSAEWTA